MTRRIRTFGVVTAVLMMISTALTFGGAPPVQGNTLPGEISDAEFWRMISDFSEAGGTYPYENFVSNEPSVQNVIPALR